jgi:hypothetical protein
VSKKLMIIIKTTFGMSIKTMSFKKKIIKDKGLKKIK